MFWKSTPSKCACVRLPLVYVLSEIPFLICNLFTHIPVHNWLTISTFSCYKKNAVMNNHEWYWSYFLFLICKNVECLAHLTASCASFQDNAKITLQSTCTTSHFLGTHVRDLHTARSSPHVYISTF